MNADGPTLLARYPEVSRHLLTVDDYHRMGEAGILREGDRVELIEGELIEMAPISSEHAACVNAINRLLILALGDRAIVAPQNPVRLDRRNEPQPDFAVLKPQPHHYRSELPMPNDVLLIIEVATSSLVYDRSVKLALYARHGIPEIWIVDLASQVLEVFRRPAGERYQSSARIGRSGSVDIEALPGVHIAADPIFG